MSQELLSEVERVLKERYKAEGGSSVTAVPSTAKRQTRATRVDQLLLPDSERAKMPLTKEQYLVQEDPQLVMWERETRKFLRGLSVLHEHRVAAVMIYEWATGLQIAELMQAEQTYAHGKTTWRADLRKINKVLEYYFGDSFSTWIAGRKVAKTYRMRKGYYVNRHRPLTLTLWVEYTAGLKP